MSKEVTVSETNHHHGVIVGVDTHKDEHVAVGINQLGVRLGEFHLTTTTRGYTALERWAMNMGEVIAFGVEGTGSYGAGLARYLMGQGHTVIEVNRPDRSTRRRQGKSDPIDAEMAARSVLSGVARDLPKSADDKVEMLRMLKTTKDSAIKARTQAINQIKALIVTAPAELRESLPDLIADSGCVYGITTMLEPTFSVRLRHFSQCIHYSLIQRLRISGLVLPQPRLHL